MCFTFCERERDMVDAWAQTQCTFDMTQSEKVPLWPSVSACALCRRTLCVNLECVGTEVIWRENSLENLAPPNLETHDQSQNAQIFLKCPQEEFWTTVHSPRRSGQGCPYPAHFVIVLTPVPLLSWDFCLMSTP